LLVPHRDLLIRLKNISPEHGEPFTVISSECASARPLQFSLARSTVLHRFAEALGWPRFYSGDQAFDAAFAVYGDSDLLLTTLWETSDLRRAIQDLPEFRLKFEHKLIHKSGRLTVRQPTGYSILELETTKLLVDPEDLRKSLNLFQRLLDRLLEQQIIRAAAPGAADARA
jgi:hypothetical protein